MKRLIRNCIEILLILTSVIYPGCMAMLSAAGWRYNVREGNYPEIFGIYSFWMFLGAGIMLIGMVSSLIGKKPKYNLFNFLSIGLEITGVCICYSILHLFSNYADQHFSGIGEVMKPVSELYQERLFPLIVPALLGIILSIWNLLENRKYRIQELEEAPKIIGEED